MTKIHMASGANDTRHWCQTTHIWQPPLPMHCATHKHQPACNPMPKIQLETQRTPPKGYPNGGGQLIELISQPSPILTKLYPTFGDIYPKCNHGGSENAGFSQNGSGHRCCHHHYLGLIWTRFLLVTLDVVIRISLNGFGIEIMDWNSIF